MSRNKKADKPLDPTSGYSMLMIRVEEGNIDAVRALLKSNPRSIDYENKIGNTCLSIAARTGNLEMASVLVYNGANFNIRNKSGQTPAFIACWYDFLEILKLLVQAGADINIPDSRGWSPLMIACYHGHTEIVRYLLSMNANIQMIDCFGKRAIDRCKTPEILEMITEAKRIWDRTHPTEEPSVLTDRNRSEYPVRTRENSTSLERLDRSFNRSPIDPHDHTHSQYLNDFNPKRTTNQFIHDDAIHKMHEKAGYYQYTQKSTNSSQMQDSYRNTEAFRSYTPISHTPVLRADHDNNILPELRTRDYDNDFPKNISSIIEESNRHQSPKYLDLPKQSSHNQSLNQSKHTSSIPEIKVNKEEVLEILHKRHSPPNRSVRDKSYRDYSRSRSPSSHNSPLNASQNKGILSPVRSPDVDLLINSLKIIVNQMLIMYHSKLQSFLNKKILFALSFEIKRNMAIHKKIFSNIVLPRVGEITNNVAQQVENNTSTFIRNKRLDNKLDSMINANKDIVITSLYEGIASRVSNINKEQDRVIDLMIRSTEEIDLIILKEFEEDLDKLLQNLQLKDDTLEGQYERSIFDSLRNEFVNSMKNLFKSINSTVDKESTKTQAQFSQSFEEMVKNSFDDLMSNIKDPLLNFPFSKNLFEQYMDTSEDDMNDRDRQSAVERLYDEYNPDRSSQPELSKRRRNVLSNQSSNVPESNNGYPNDYLPTDQQDYRFQKYPSQPSISENSRPSNFPELTFDPQPKETFAVNDVSPEDFENRESFAPTESFDPHNNEVNLRKGAPHKETQIIKEADEEKEQGTPPDSFLLKKNELNLGAIKKPIDIQTDLSNGQDSDRLKPQALETPNFKGLAPNPEKDNQPIPFAGYPENNDILHEIEEIPEKEASKEKEIEYDKLIQLTDEKREKLQQMAEEVEKVMQESRTETSTAKSFQSDYPYNINVPSTIPKPTPSKYVKEIKQRQIDEIPLSESFQEPGQPKNNSVILYRSPDRVKSETTTPEKLSKSAILNASPSSVPYHIAQMVGKWQPNK